jgi:class 3 adenylate cyclase/pimeloyl-ACP methyl ester carboxylesterase
VRPETKYAKSGQVSVAYQVTGKGPPDMVWAPGIFSHLDLDWDWPPKARLIERLSSFSRLIRFDKRGTGLSDHPTDAATLEERIDDIRAVMDATGSETAVVLGTSEGGSMASVFAATYPGRTRSLVLVGVQARWTKAPDYPWGSTSEEQQKVVDDLAEDGVTLSYLDGLDSGSNRDASPEFLQWYLRYARAGGSPAAMAALERMSGEIDTRDILPTIQVPTLVVNTTGDPVANVDAARYLCSRIPNAKFLELPGVAHGMTQIADQIVPAIEAFVTGTTGSNASDRVLATILFMDIVDSTRQATQMGDSAWKNFLGRFNDIAHHAVASYRGRKVKSTGDGFLATFDGPTRAIQCARAVGEALSELGLQVRAGLHSGECELLSDDIGGVAVHLAARIVAAAGPGQVLVSSTTRDLVAGSDLRFKDQGLFQLKGFPEERRLFALDSAEVPRKVR